MTDFDPQLPRRAEDDEVTRLVLPVVEEEITIEKRVVETGLVRIRKTVEAEEVLVDEPLSHEVVEVQRVPRGEWVEAAPTARQEGDTLIVPVVEEVLVVEKRLRLVEEVHIRRQQTTVSTPQSVTLRRETVTVEREGLNGEATADDTATRSDNL